MRTVLLASLVGILSCLPGFSQATTLGSIVGNVFDPTSASVPNAQVRVINTGTGVARDTTTNENGAFQVLSLIPGTYSVEVSAPSFQKQVQEKINLEVAGAVTVDFRLSVGQVTETVRVDAQADMINAVEGVIATTIENKKVVDLPLNGRNFVNLMRLTPGATRGNTGTGPTLNGASYAVTGSRSDNTNYTLDGTPNNGTFFKTVALTPSVDAINEFKIQTNMSARYGAAAGANVNVSIKSGTNELHGTAYEFFRNAKLDSRDYFAARRPDFKFNQFGFSLGGPVRVPKLYDGRNRTFFFFNYEGLQQRRGVTQLGTIPNAAWRSGDLSLNLDGRTALPQIYDPATTRQTGVNAQGQPIYTRDPFPGNRIPEARVVPYARAYLNLWFPNSLPIIPGLNNSNFINATSQRREDNQTHTRIDHKFSDNNNFFARVSWADLSQVSPRSLPNASGVTYNKYLSLAVSDTHVINPTTVLDVRLGFLRADLGEGPVHRFIDVYRSAGLSNVPTLFRDFDFPVNFNIAGLTGPGNGNLVNGPDFTRNGSIALTKTVGRHTLAFGYDYTQLRIIHDSVFLNLDFNTVATADPQNQGTTGAAFASFLLGLPNGGGRITGEADLDIDQKLHHAFVQDDFRVNSRLTVNLGLRYEYNEWPHHRRGRMGGYDLTSGVYYWTGTNPITGQPPNIRNTIAEPQYLNFAPRIGFAYRATDRTVIRSAYGIFYNSNFGWEWSTGRGNWPYSISENLAGINIPGVPLQRADQLFGSFDPSAVVPAAQHTISRDLQTPYMQNWNFGVEQQLTQSLLLEVNYQGAKGTNLSSFLSTNDPLPGPGAVNPRRPLPAAGPVSELKMVANSRYNALTTKLQQRFDRGLSFVASYAYQKNIDQNSSFGGTSPQNNLDIAAEMAPSDFDQTHVFNSGFTYELPGPRRGVASWFIGGWQTTGLVTLETGRPFNVTLPFDNANVGARGNFQRPNLVGDPFPSGWQKQYGPGGLYLDPSAFAVPAQYTFGNLARNALRGPGFKNVDISAFKNFNFTERARLQFRSEFYNAFNFTNFGNPGGSFNPQNLGNFGRITGTVGQFTTGNQRSIQLALKLIF